MESALRGSGKSGIVQRLLAEGDCRLRHRDRQNGLRLFRESRYWRWLRLWIGNITCDGLRSWDQVQHGEQFAIELFGAEADEVADRPAESSRMRRSFHSALPKAEAGKSLIHAPDDGFRSVKVGILRGTAGGGAVSGQAALHFSITVRFGVKDLRRPPGRMAGKVCATACVADYAAGLTLLQEAWRRRYPRILFRAPPAPSGAFRDLFGNFQAHVDAMLCAAYLGVRHHFGSTAAAPSRRQHASVCCWRNTFRSNACRQFLPALQAHLAPGVQRSSQPEALLVLRVVTIVFGLENLSCVSADGFCLSSMLRCLPVPEMVVSWRGRNTRVGSGLEQLFGSPLVAVRDLHDCRIIGFCIRNARANRAFRTPRFATLPFGGRRSVLPACRLSEGKLT